MKRILLSLLVISGSIAAMEQAACSTEAAVAPTVQLRCSDDVVLTVSKDVLQESGYFRGCLNFGGSEKETGFIMLKIADSKTMQVIVTALEAMSGKKETVLRQNAVRAVLSENAYEPQDLENLALFADYFDIPELYEVVMKILFEHQDTPQAFANDLIGQAHFNCKMPSRVSYRCNVLEGGVQAATWSPCGKLLVTIALGGSVVRTWDAQTWECKDTLQLAKRQHLHRTVLSACGRLVATMPWSGNTVSILDVGTGACIHTLEHTDTVRHIVWSLCGRFIATESFDKIVKIWDIETGKCKCTWQYTDGMTHFLWSPCSKFIATVSALQNEVVRIWDAETGICKHTLNNLSRIGKVAWSPCSRFIATAGWDKIARIWDTETGVCKHTLQHARIIAWSPCGRFIATASASHDEVVRIWDTETEAYKCTWECPSGVNEVVWSPCGKFIATALNGAVRIWDTETGAYRRTLPYSSSVVAWSPCGNLIATVDGKGPVHIQDFRDNKTYVHALFLVWALSLKTQDISVCNERLNSCYKALPAFIKRSLTAKGYVFHGQADVRDAHERFAELRFDAADIKRLPIHQLFGLQRLLARGKFDFADCKQFPFGIRKRLSELQYIKPVPEQ